MSFGSSALASAPLASEGAVQEVVADPVASISGGTFSVPQLVTLSTTTSGASIYYTTDGSTPDATDTLYSGAISISSTTTLKFIGIKSGATDSAVVTESYVISTSGDVGFSSTAIYAAMVNQVGATPKHINSKLLAFYQANGATSGVLGTAEKEFLLAQGASGTSVTTLWEDFLTTVQGYSGTLNDKLAQYWESLK